MKIGYVGTAACKCVPLVSEHDFEFDKITFQIMYGPGKSVNER